LVKDLAICNLLHRRYLLLPAIPDDLAALAHEHVGGTSFKVICVAECRYESKLVVFTFASRDGQWHTAEFDGWKALTAAPANRSPTFAPPELSRRDFAHGCFCWVMRERKKLLVLDTNTMEFSSFDTPPLRRPHGSAIVEAGEGRFGMFTIYFDRGSGTYSLSYTVLRDEIQSSNQWKSDATIQLPVNYDYNILGVAGGYLLLLGILHGHHHDLIIPISERPNMDCFSLNLRTFSLSHFVLLSASSKMPRCMLVFHHLYLYRAFDLVSLLLNFACFLHSICHCYTTQIIVMAICFSMAFLKTPLIVHAT
jgi:hypothetical protein